ncbi:class I SAM-dependent methyltransferase [uncultured Treponema sp.]|uniref:class I SAM-dependent methyltransferase n=1 Tax=uncultured Treponema sp. TaxID=162155 RepID=UPI0025E08D8B|nr:methyltransferase domain-containing protein [uncultured Treponema sp.]
MSLGTGFFSSNKYDSVRSEYSPLAAVEVHRLFAEKKQLQIAEVGAGSGKFTSVILNAGLDIKKLYIVEPDTKGVELHREKFSSVLPYSVSYYNMTSDATGLPSKSIDIIFIAHAFHWFLPEQTKFEFKRILKEHGKVFILARFLDEMDPISATYISLTRWGKRQNGLKNNIESYSKEKIRAFFGMSVEKKIICSETEMHSRNRLLDETDVRIDSSDDDMLKSDINLRNKKKNDIIEFYNQNNTNGYVPLKFNTFYFCSEII